ncbi:taste receptor type 2 member 9-like [Mantella aurantiaca]
MVALLWAVGFIVAIVECVLGVLFNSYIIALNVAHWRRGLAPSLCDKILVLMAVNNICLQCDMNICTFIFIVFPKMLQYPNIYSPISVFLIFQFYFSFWITAALCVYYCLRIVSFKLHFFIHLKANITNVLTRFLIGSVVGSLTISVVSIWEIHVKLTVNITSSPVIIDSSIEIGETYKYLTIFMGCCLPFMLAVLCVILTLTSLCRHYHSMKSNHSGFSIPRLDAHMRAARIMLYLITLYAIFYLSEVNLLASSLTVQSTWQMASLFFVLIYPTTQSTIVIMGNSKLCPTCLSSVWLGKKV